MVEKETVMLEQHPHLSVHDNADMLATAMAEALANKVLQHAGERSFCMALSGGSTPQRLYRRLAEPPFLQKIPWSRVVFFFGDERCVPPEHPDSNYRMVFESLLCKIPSTVYRMEAALAQAESYQEMLERLLPHNAQGIPVFDLVLLGVGQDGHTASLFPGTTALHEQHRWVVMNDVPQLQTRRMTLTFPILNAAQDVWMMATGTSKKPIVEVLFGTRQNGLHSLDSMDWPIVQIRPVQGKITWWVDREAISGS